MREESKASTQDQTHPLLSSTQSEEADIRLKVKDTEWTKVAGAAVTHPT